MRRVRWAAVISLFVSWFAAPAGAASFFQADVNPPVIRPERYDALSQAQRIELLRSHFDAACRRRGLARFGVDAEVFLKLVRQESGFNHRAVSPAGAAGICQFMPGTARRYGLIVDRAAGVDERFDPVKSAWACVAYLADLLELFGGNLSLALAGYNAGEHRVLRAGGIPNIAETRNYVRAILGAAPVRRSRSVPVPTEASAPPPDDGEVHRREAVRRLENELAAESVVVVR